MFIFLSYIKYFLFIKFFYFKLYIILFACCEAKILLAIIFIIYIMFLTQELIFPTNILQQVLLQ